jgi:hypothetical protein
MSVSHKIPWPGRTLAAFEVRGRSNGNDACLPELSGNQAGNRRFSDMDGNFEALADEIAESITSD